METTGVSPAIVDAAFILSLTGSVARLWSFAATHDRLTIRVRKSKAGDEGFLIFSLCETLRLPVMWTLKNPQVKTAELMQFIDEGVEITCAEIRWQDDVPT